ncbi:hypothetical protein [Hymenobacter volaticus]|nr:hypothetical protein [Hymenobacter volaticus]
MPRYSLYPAGFCIYSDSYNHRSYRQRARAVRAGTNTALASTIRW